MLKSFWSKGSYAKPVSTTGRGRKGVYQKHTQEVPDFDVTLLRIAWVYVSLVIHYLYSQELVFKCLYLA